MGIVKINPISHFDALARQITNFANNNEQASNTRKTFQPKVEIYEKANKYFIDAELAGLNKDNISLTIEEAHTFVLKGKKEKQENHENGNMLRNERIYGEFVRKFVLPEDANVESIEAKFENGVLQVVIDKKVAEAPKEIKIEIQ